MNLIGNGISVGFGLSLYAAIGLIKMTDPDFRTVGALLMCTVVGSAIESTYQHKFAGFKF